MGGHARTDERRAYERERHARLMATDPDYGDAMRAKRRRYHARHRERVNVGRVERQRATPEQHRAARRRYEATPGGRAAKRRYDGKLASKRLHADRMQERRVRLVDGHVELVDRVVLYERDRGICGICGDPVDAMTFHLDHIIPLARGGEHSYANAQVAHADCNRRKGASLEGVV